ncbi:MAG: PEPxxWA-CTERM sorting domain-containing protein [Pseudomonadota bacterium]
MSRTFAGLAAALVVSAAFPAAAATTIVLDFDDLTGLGAMPSTYQGVAFEDFSYYDTPKLPQYPTKSGMTSLYANYDRHQPGSASTSIFRFGDDVRFDGAWFAGRLAVVFELYRDGQRVHTSSPLGLNSTMQYLASGYDGLVDEVRLYGNSGNWVMDDLTYSVGDFAAPAPEPATWAMMILGFGAAGAVIRRRRGVAFAI